MPAPGRDWHVFGQGDRYGPLKTTATVIGIATVINGWSDDPAATEAADRRDAAAGEAGHRDGSGYAQDEEGVRSAAWANGIR